MVTPANAKALTGRTRPPIHKGEVERKDGVVPKVAAVTVAERVDAAHMRGEDLSELSVAKLGELENRVSTALKNIQRKKAFRMAWDLLSSDQVSMPYPIRGYTKQL